VGANQKGAITTAVDRGSKLVRISLPTSKKANEVANETIRILKDFKDKIHTITSDNGLEFAFLNITKKEIKIIEDKLNNRPRKSLGWRTPNEVFFGLEIAA